MENRWEKTVRFCPIWRFHPEVAIRYLPVISKLKERALDKASLLEVGSGSLGIAPYIMRPVTGVDVNFDGPQTDLLTKIRADATKIPLPDKSFDVVIMIDVIEHVPKSLRSKVIKEGLRIAKKLLIVAAPEGNEAKHEDSYLASYYYKVFGKSFPYYDEHIKYGIPTQNWIAENVKKIARESGRLLKIESEGNSPINLHRFLMKGWITKNIIIDILFRKGMLLLIPLFLIYKKAPYYRKIVYCYLD